MQGTLLTGRSEHSSSVDIKKTNILSPVIVASGGSSFPQYNYTPGFGIGQKHIQYIDPYIFPGSSSTSFYSRRFSFIIPSGGYLSQILLECQLTTAGDNTLSLLRLASRLFSKIELCTVNGCKVIQSIDANYINARLDQMQFQNNQITKSLDPKSTWNNNTVTVYTPVFMTIFNDKMNFLNTNCIEPLQLVCYTNSSSTKIGIPNDISDFAIRAMCFYIDTIEQPLQIQRVMMNTDVYNELPVTLTNGSSSLEIPITCPYPCLNMMIQIYSSSNVYLTTNMFTLKASGHEIISLSRRANYALDNPTENNSSGALTYWFSLDQTRQSQQLAINMKDLYCKSLYLEFDSVPNSTYTLYVSFEYWNQLIVTSNGKLCRQLLY